MGRPAVVSNHFSSGWISPAIGARADLPERMNGLLDAENVVIPPQGGVKKRPCLSVLARADGVERIFPWHRNEQEKFVVGVDSAGKVRIYNADFGAGDLETPAIDGSLSFANAARLNAFHYADTLIVTADDQPPQEVVLQDRSALVAARRVRTIREVGLTLDAIPDTLEGREDAPEFKPFHYPGVSLKLSIGTESQTAPQTLLAEAGLVYYNGVFTIGGVEYVVFVAAGRRLENPTWSVTLRAQDADEFIPTDADIRLEVSRAGITDEIDLVSEATGISPSAQAEGFEAQKMKIINPPVVKLSDAEFKAAKASSAVADFCLNIPEPASVGAKPANKGQVLIWNGTELVRQPARAAEAAVGDAPAGRRWRRANRMRRNWGCRRGIGVWRGTGGTAGRWPRGFGTGG